MDKKYTAKEAAQAVLKKAEEMLKSSNLAKSKEDKSKMSGHSGLVRLDTTANQNQKGVGQHGHHGSSGGTSEAGAYHRDSMHTKPGTTQHLKNTSAVKEIHKQTLGDLRSQPKPNLTKEEDVTPPNGVQKETIGQHDPAAEKENGNPPWGTEPGCHKLSKFMGRREERKKAKASLAVTNVPIDKAEKGVHTQYDVGSKADGPGTSLAGQMAREKNPNTAAQHKAKLSELKAMPKPNLTKGEGNE